MSQRHLLVMIIEPTGVVTVKIVMLLLRRAGPSGRVLASKAAVGAAWCINIDNDLMNAYKQMENQLERSLVTMCENWKH